MNFGFQFSMVGFLYCPTSTLRIYKYKYSSILAVIYLTKLQNLINLPVMNCSMSSFSYFYFSNYILFDFPSSGLIFL